MPPRRQRRPGLGSPVVCFTMQPSGCLIRCRQHVPRVGAHTRTDRSAPRVPPNPRARRRTRHRRAKLRLARLCLGRQELGGPATPVTCSVLLSELAARRRRSRWIRSRSDKNRVVSGTRRGRADQLATRAIPRTPSAYAARLGFCGASLHTWRARVRRPIAARPLSPTCLPPLHDCLAARPFLAMKRYRNIVKNGQVNSKPGGLHLSGSSPKLWLLAFLVRSKSRAYIEQGSNMVSGLAGS